LLFSLVFPGYNSLNLVFEGYVVIWVTIWKKSVKEYKTLVSPRNSYSTYGTAV
jgi:hypothetical protein